MAVRVDPIVEPAFRQHLLHARELRDGERALERVVAARVEEHDDGRVAAEGVVERDGRAVVVLERERTRAIPSRGGSARGHEKRPARPGGSSQQRSPSAGSRSRRRADRRQRASGLGPRLLREATGLRERLELRQDAARVRAEPRQRLEQLADGAGGGRRRVLAIVVERHRVVVIPDLHRSRASRTAPVPARDGDTTATPAPPRQRDRDRRRCRAPRGRSAAPRRTRARRASATSTQPRISDTVAPPRWS